MTNTQYFKKNENVQLLTLMFLIILGHYITERYYGLSLYWIVIIFITGNARRIYSKKFRKVYTFVRRSCYIVPFLLALVFKDKISFSFEYDIKWILLAVFLGVIFILPKINVWLILLSDENISSIEKHDKYTIFMNIYTFLGGAISEEIFFRYFCIGYFIESSNWIAVSVSVFLFFLNHYGVKWNECFTAYDYIIQIIFGIISGILLVVTNSIIPCITMHIVYNLPHVLLQIKILNAKKNGVKSY